MPGEDRKDHKLQSIRDFKRDHVNLHDRNPKLRIDSRDVIFTTEKYIKDEQRWPANIEKEKEQREEEREEKLKNKLDNLLSGDDETDSDSGIGSSDREGSEKEETDPEKNEDKMAPLDKKFLNDVRAEVDLFLNMKDSIGKDRSPVADYPWRPQAIDDDDTMTPDNWIPRSKALTRLTGKHPFNASATLTELFDAGLITPNKLHYVRSHASVPKLDWETHRLHIDSENGCLQPRDFSMDEIQDGFEWVNIPVMICCTGNRRKELNMLKQTTGFNWINAAVGCAYWKGALLRDVLVSCGVGERPAGRPWYVHFRGADDCGKDYYETSLKFDYVMDPANDVLLAYEQNNVKLFPDHGYPLRLIVPGYIGGRHVKWLSKIWISDKPNESHLHIWDNRMPPSFITRNDTPLAEAFYRHPDTVCMEAVLQSVIAKPAHDEVLDLSAGVDQDATYALEGYAYDGNGGVVQRVVVSLDGGASWLYAFRKYPDNPLRHANKFWTWCFWRCEVPLVDLLNCKEIVVRCYGAGNVTQPESSTWNLMGHQNNAWYRVRTEFASVRVKDGKLCENGVYGEERMVIRFRHPVAEDDSGWMVDQTAKEGGDGGDEGLEVIDAGEIEKHNSDTDCWIVVNKKVYDATSVLSWHPGGAGAIMGYAGALKQESSTSYNAIHPQSITEQHLNKLVVGRIDDKAAEEMEKEAVKYEKDRQAEASDERIFQKYRWINVELVNKKEVSEDVRLYTFRHYQKDGLKFGIGQHMQVGFHLSDKMVSRPYTMTRPAGADEDDGTFDLLIKTYFPTDENPGGTVSNLMDMMEVGGSFEIKGPEGRITYHGEGMFNIGGQSHHFRKVNFISGGTGMTPIWQTIKYMLECEDEEVQVHFIDANTTEDEILLHRELDDMQEKHKNFGLTHIVHEPAKDWKGETGLIDEKRMKKYLHAPSDDTVVLICGPPGMVKAAQKSLLEWGFVEEKNLFSY